MSDERESKSSLDALRLSNEESKKFTKKCLLGALLRLVRKKPFEKISISELVSQAGVSRTAFYRHYNAIEDVIKEPVFEILEAIKSSLNDEKYCKEPFVWYVDLLLYLKENKEVLETLMIITNGQMVTLGVLDEIFESGSEGERARYEMEAFKGGISSALARWIADGYTASPQTVAEICCQIQNSMGIALKNSRGGEDFC